MAKEIGRTAGRKAVSDPGKERGSGHEYDEWLIMGGLLEADEARKGRRRDHLLPGEERCARVCLAVAGMVSGTTDAARPAAA